MVNLRFFRNHPRTVSIAFFSFLFVLIVTAIVVTITQVSKQNVEPTDTTISPTETPQGQNRNPQTPSLTPAPSQSRKEPTQSLVTSTKTPVASTKAPVVVSTTPEAEVRTPSPTVTITPTPSSSSSVSQQRSPIISEQPDVSAYPSSPPADENNHGCSAVSQCSFVDHFHYYDTTRWTATDYGANGGAFGAWWDRSKVDFNYQNGLKLFLSPDPALDKEFASGQLQSNGWFEYGCFEASIKPANASGLVTGFFLYTGEYDSAPGEPMVHNEIDFEFVWRRQAKQTIVQTNYFTNGRKEKKRDIYQKFEVSEQFHVYSMKWTSTSVTWFIDGDMVRYVNDGSTPIIKNSGPLKIFLNFWPIHRNNKNATRWGGKYEHDYDAPLPSSFFQWVRYSKGENCQLHGVNGSSSNNSKS